MLAVVALAAVFAPLLAPYDPTAQLDIVRLKSQPPSLAHPLGTDPFSRDVLSRVLYGARVSLAVGLARRRMLAMTFGIAVGAVAGYRRRRRRCRAHAPRRCGALDPARCCCSSWSSRSGDSLGLVPLTLLMAGTGWFAVSRLVRAETLALRERDFVVAARALGASPLAHPGPPRAAERGRRPAIVAATLGVAQRDPARGGAVVPRHRRASADGELGRIIQDGAERVSDLWWLTVFPGLAILVTVFACNALGDALRDALDPRQLPRDRTPTRPSPEDA